MAKPALPTLLKLADKALEDVQQQLHANQSLQGKAQAQIAHWEQEVATGFASAITETAVGDLQAAHAYQHRAAAAIRKLEAEIATHKTLEATLRLTLQAAYTKQQQYKQLLEAQTQAAKTIASRKAQAALDDLRRPD